MGYAGFISFYIIKRMLEGVGSGPAGFSVQVWLEGPESQWV